MTAISTTVFSEYEVRHMNVIMPDTSVGSIKCIGQVEEEAEVRVVTKKCRGVVAKSRTRGTGSGTLKLTGHIPHELYIKLHNMDSEANLKEGVSAYGKNSIHPVVCITADVFDEDDVEKFKAYPVCTVSTGPARTVENGAEEVAEVEMEIAFSPDDYGDGIYEALADELDPTLKSQWMEGFTPALVRDEEA